MNRTPILALPAALLALAVAGAAPRDIPAFPGAQGFGANTPGGRGGRIIEVKNLNSRGPGSLYAACRAKGPRIVIFRVSGIITRHCRGSVETDPQRPRPNRAQAGRSAGSRVRPFRRAASAPEARPEPPHNRNP